MKLTGAQIVIECLIEQGVDTVFGYPGGSILNIYDELYKNEKRIRHILTSHEQGAAHAADGYARSTGRTGVCFATSGPGATNLVTGIATAYMDSVPVVFITCNVNKDLIGKDGFQEADITGITMPITKNNYIVRNIDDLADTVREAFAVATTGRPGPVLVDIPKNITAEKAEYKKAKKDELELFRKKGLKYGDPDPRKIEEAVELINKSEKPFILCGGGVIISKAEKELLALSRKIKAPVACTLMGLGGFPADDLKFTGMIGMHGTKASNLSASKCDLFIAIGTRFSDRVIGDVKKFAGNAKILHIDIDKAEIDKNVLSSLSIVGNAKDILKELNIGTEEKKDDTWLKDMISYNKNPASSLTPKDRKDILTPEGILAAVNEIAEEDTIITTDVGQHQMWTGQYYKFKLPRTFISSGGFGTMGYGLGAAMGCAIGNQDKLVVHISGDGSFRMNCNELATVEHYDIPTITIIFNNGVLGMVRQWQKVFYDERYSNTVLDRGPDFKLLAEAYGIKGYTVCNEADFRKTFEEASKSGKAAVINCILHKDSKVVPMVAPGTDILEFIYC